MLTATIFDIQRNSYVDGTGVRTTVFFKGCNLRCAWCHNPESQLHEKQMMFYKDKCTGCGKCEEVCPHHLEYCDFCGRCELYCPHDARKICGREYTVSEVFTEVVKDKSFYDNSGGGVTFSGGECMLQIDFLEEILKKSRASGIHTAVDTAGHVPYSFFERILPYTNLFLYNLKCIDNDVHKQYTGQGNELILENLKKLLSTGSEVWVRIPIIPTINDSVEEMRKIKRFFETYGQPEKIELLPYHAMGEHKYSALGKPVPKFDIPTPQRIEELKRILQLY